MLLRTVFAAFTSSITLVALVGACGGTVDTTGSGGAGTGGSAGGTTGKGGGSSGGGQSCTGAPFECYAFCGSDVVGAATCVGGAWTCMPGFVTLDQCPQGSCVYAPTAWNRCCDASGVPHDAFCPDHYTLTCAPGQTLVDPAHSGCTAPPGCEATGCAAGQACFFGDTFCGAGIHGHCVDVPNGCVPQDAPVCGCDGKIYPDACTAEVSGVDVGTACTPPDGYTLCGPRLCKLGPEYCQVTVTPSGDQFDCVPTPTSCGALPTCACLASQPCGSMCSDGVIPGWIKLTC